MLPSMEAKGMEDSLVRPGKSNFFWTKILSLVLSTLIATQNQNWNKISKRSNISMLEKIEKHVKIHGQPSALYVQT